jgi:hypothetical protein
MGFKLCVYRKSIEFCFGYLLCGSRKGPILKPKNEIYKTKLDI